MINGPIVTPTKFIKSAMAARTSNPKFAWANESAFIVKSRMRTGICLPSREYSNEVLGSIFGLHPKILEALPKYQEDLFVVAAG
ncbi:MAG TPA: hypothetical protein VFI73_00650 [Candidatus Nitrosopolaris sp.]|nr:hypothetical protein [Candidatus Nitrosopolaris sp.]